MWAGADCTRCGATEVAVDGTPSEMLLLGEPSGGPPYGGGVVGGGPATGEGLEKWSGIEEAEVAVWREGRLACA